MKILVPRTWVTSWASHVTAREVDQAPLNYMNLSVIFGHDIDHESTHRLKAGLYFLCPERFDRNNDPKKIRKGPELVTRKMKQKAGFPSVCS